MTAPGGFESVEIEALVTDRYLEALLAAAERRAPDAPALPELDPTVRAAARRLRDELVRVHPSFRFEERLARRLGEAAAGMRLAAAGGDATVVPFPGRLLDDPDLAGELDNPDLAALVRSPAATTGAPLAADGQLVDIGRPGDAVPAGTLAADARPAARNPLFVGGAVTSAALSLAGAAFVAWRLSRGAPTDPMARAVRATRAARTGRGLVPGGLA